ncbi:MAG: superoxide dismutase family protein [Burkholderiales bacterium]
MRRLAFPALLVLGALASGCALFTTPPGRAVAELHPTRGHTASGTVTFVQVGDRVHVHAVVSGLAPGREHAFLIHEVGDCSAPDASSAKGDFNPFGKPHAHYSTPERHAGDMPALAADAKGRADLDVSLDIITLGEGPANILGRSVVVHARPDDYRTQPDGNSGPRVACGVIRAVPTN